MGQNQLKKSRGFIRF
ncbi:Kinesin-like protein KIN-13A [Zea mays]|uniref:Kinesin-like protein KIN-13A n=1 Tax=Zea mays TaxID=4577 RepID=A0A1D6FMA4_MAIZE|nr:Kinesin-like protein KIN-13A [Zea mays]AQK92798.1 Kinesin-like protein KIN-13A [Zea mays]